MTKKILILTKNYPPQIGGIEKYSFDTYNRLLKEGNDVKLIAARPRSEQLFTARGTKFSYSKMHWHILYILSELLRLTYFLFDSLLRGILFGKNDLVWCMDGSLAGLGLFLGFLTHAKVRVTFHGTEVVWENSVYQVVMPYFWRYVQEIYVVSTNTRQEIIKRGIAEEKILLVPNSLETLDYADPGIFNKRDFLKNLGISMTEDKIFLFSLGRWIERKGFHWFLEEVFPLLDKHKFHYILAGFGPYESEYRRIISKNHLNNVTLLGKIEDPIFRARLYSVCDAFIMPNLLVHGNVEGHPLVLLEAKFYNLKKLVGFVQGADQDKDTFFCENDVNVWLKHLGEL